MNWYIGQEVVCVDPLCNSGLRKDETYTIESISKSKCGCKGVMLHVGFTLNTTLAGCLDCGYRVSNYNGPWWFAETRFAPLMDITELKEILNEEIQRV